LRRSRRTTAPGFILQARAPALQHIGTIAKYIIRDYAATLATPVKKWFLGAFSTSLTPTSFHFCSRTVYR
jgi:hypothetical protein